MNRSDSLMDISPDPQYLPRSSDLPDALLEHAAGPAAPPPDEAHWLALWDVLEPNLWSVRQTNSLLPGPLQAKHAKCRRRAAHLQKTSSSGHVSETVNPISCGDRVSCGCCSFAYKNDRMMDHAERLREIALNGACEVHFVEIRATIPEFDALTTIAGCDYAEALGGRCHPRSRCTACKHALKAANRRIEITQGARDWLRREYIKRSPGVGVLASATPEAAPGAAVQLVFTLVVPQIAIGGPLGRQPATPVDRAQLFDDFRAWLQNQHEGAEVVGGSFDMSQGTQPQHRFRTGPAMDWNATTRQLNELLARMHEPAWHRFHRAVIEAVQAGITVTPEHARRALRAVSLEAETVTGKNRRWQDTVWCGAWASGARLRANLGQLNIDIIEPDDRPAKTEILDVYRILAHLDTGDVAVQSVRTSETKVIERRLARFGHDDTVDSAGRPTRARSKSYWKGADQWRLYQEKMDEMKAAILKRRARFAASKTEFANRGLGKLDSEGTR